MGFQECETCANKPGMPVLCDGCLNNRQFIDSLQELLQGVERVVSEFYDTNDLVSRIRP